MPSCHNYKISKNNDLCIIDIKSKDLNKNRCIPYILAYVHDLNFKINI